MAWTIVPNVVPGSVHTAAMLNEFRYAIIERAKAIQAWSYGYPSYVVGSPVDILAIANRITALISFPYAPGFFMDIEATPPKRFCTDADPDMSNIFQRCFGTWDWPNEAPTAQHLLDMMTVLNKLKYVWISYSGSMPCVIGLRTRFWPGPWYGFPETYDYGSETAACTARVTALDECECASGLPGSVPSWVNELIAGPMHVTGCSDLICIDVRQEQEEEGDDWRARGFQERTIGRLVIGPVPSDPLPQFDDVDYPTPDGAVYIKWNGYALRLFPTGPIEWKHPIARDTVQRVRKYDPNVDGDPPGDSPLEKFENAMTHGTAWRTLTIPSGTEKNTSLWFHDDDAPWTTELVTDGDVTLGVGDEVAFLWLTDVAIEDDDAEDASLISGYSGPPYYRFGMFAERSLVMTQWPTLEFKFVKGV
ncbi:MAG TPA: hypothetical protein VMY37_03225 [Thermoguttaceae bacterium]|nr:hypothetical protein [Thermoguttaceae bacterium]